MESQATQQQSPTPSGRPSGAIELLAWLEVNKKRLLVGGAIVTVGFLVVALFLQQQSQRERSASRAFSDIKVPVNPAQAAAPGTVDALVKLANDYRGTKAAPRALLASAGLLFVEKKYADAAARFAQVTTEYPGSPWTAEALLGVAASLEAQGKTAEATAKYEDLRKGHEKSPVIDETKLALAGLYETQKPEEAYKLYDDLIKTMPGSPVASEARMRQDELLKARPELAKLRESLVPPTAPPVVAPAVQRIPLTNAPAGTSKPVQIQLTPTPAPAPVPTTPPAVAPAVQTTLLTNAPAGTSKPAQIKLTPPPAPAPAPAPGK